MIWVNLPLPRCVKTPQTHRLYLGVVAQVRQGFAVMRQELEPGVGDRLGNLSLLGAEVVEPPEKTFAKGSFIRFGWPRLSQSDGPPSISQKLTTG